MGRNKIYKTVGIRCKNCNIVFFINENKVLYRKTCSYKCLGEMKSRLNGEQTNGWKGGFFIDKDGYKMVRVAKIGKKYKREHHLVMENYIGKKLNEKEVVHHWDCDRQNNNIDNLTLFRHQTAHRRLHGFAERHGLDISLFKFNQPWLVTT